MSVISPADVRPRLNKTVATDDDEIQEMIDAAEAEFEELIGPLAVTPYTEQHAGPVALLQRPVAAVQSVVDLYGTAVLPSEYSLNAAAGILTIGRAGSFTVTYTVGYDVLPANYREVIIADVAGYFSRTQRGGSANRPAFPGDEFAESPAGFGSGPVSMWPRIAALAARKGPVLA